MQRIFGAKVLLLCFVFLLVGVVFVAPAFSKSSIKAGLIFGLTGAASPVGPVQLDGAKLAIKEINEAGGVKLGDKRVPLTFVVKDDETKPDVALRRFRELVYQEKVDFVLGQTFASISAALNEEVKKVPVAYFPVNVVALDMFSKDKIAPYTFAIHGSAYCAGYASAAYIVKNLGLKNVYFFGPAYAFGWDQWKGAKAALDKLGAKYEYIESPVGTTDFTPYLTKIAAANPDIVMLAHWGNDAINVLKQVYETGLKEKTKIWFNWMTNVFGSGVPPEALEGVYSLMSWYYDLTGFEDESVVAKSKEFSEKFIKEYGYPPDPYSLMAYLGVKEAVRAIEIAQSTKPQDIAKALLENPKFDSVKGPGEWRIDHQALFKYGAFVVVGKGPAERKDPKWDLVKVIGYYAGEDYLPPLEELGY